MAKTTRCYQLVYVGAICPKKAPEREPEVLAYFQEFRRSKKTINSAPLLEQPIPVQFASTLLTGAKWSIEGKMLSDGTDTYPDSRSLLLGNYELRLIQLSELIPFESDQPDFLKQLPRESWYAAIDIKKEIILIPCFELLRNFCYQGAGALSNFLFSRLPLETLCWPVCSPTEENSFAAHFCVASALIRFNEARILAELLFNEYYRNFIKVVHASICLQWNKCFSEKQICKAYVKAPFFLGKPVQVTAHGFSFAIRDKSYFWVSQLKNVGNWHAFNKVFFHPLQAQSSASADIHNPFPKSVQHSFEDVLHGQLLRPAIPLTPEFPKEFKSFKFDNRSSRSDYNLPIVVRSFSWAERIPADGPSSFANASILNFLWARPGYLLNEVQVDLPENHSFHSVMQQLALVGCAITILNINNNCLQFGLANSIIPYVCAPNSYTHLSDGRYRPISIAHIEWGKGNFYIFNLLDNPKFALSFHRNLAAWKPDEYNNFLVNAVSCNFDWPNEISSIYNTRQYYQTACFINNGPENAAALCHAEIKRAIARYNNAVDAAERVRDYMRNYPFISEESAINLMHDKEVDGLYPGNYIGESRVRT